MIGRIELPGIEGYPQVERHRLAWAALGRARLPKPLRPVGGYETRLVTFMCRFLPGGLVPDREEFAGVVDESLRELRDAECAAGADVTVEQRAAWRQAVAWLKAADVFAEKTMS